MTHAVTLYLIAVSWWDAIITRLAARWERRAVEVQPTATGRHRLTGSPVFDREDYEWAMAIKRMAARMEAHHAWR